MAATDSAAERRKAVDAAVREIDDSLAMLAAAATAAAGRRVGNGFRRARAELEATRKAFAAASGDGGGRPRTRCPESVQEPAPAEAWEALRQAAGMPSPVWGGGARERGRPRLLDAYWSTWAATELDRGTSVASVAARLNVSPGTIYRHFPRRRGVCAESSAG